MRALGPRDFPALKLNLLLFLLQAVGEEEVLAPGSFSGFVLLACALAVPFLACLLRLWTEKLRGPQRALLPARVPLLLGFSMAYGYLMLSR